jgi:malate dehydrogenase (oxaloacetate-decarboxylating)(NADP+)
MGATMLRVLLLLAVILWQTSALAADCIKSKQLIDDAALSQEIRERLYPECRLKGEANLLIMPNVDAANISFNLIKATSGDGITVGPVLLGAAQPVHILTPTATVRRLVNMTALAVVDANHLRGVR